MANLEDVTNWLRGLSGRPPSYSTPPPKMMPASENPPYPTHDDVDFARKNDFSYGSPYAREFTGNSMRLVSGNPLDIQGDTPLKGRTFTNDQGFRDDALARAQLAANRSALATLGFDPTKMALDYTRDPNNVTATGLTRYDPENHRDEMYVNARDPSSLVH